MTFETLASQGNQTVYGSMAAGIGPRVKEIRNEFIKDCFSDFSKTEHRLEYVANVHGLEFINDSKSTNINSTWFSLECMNKPIIWIAGYLNKGFEFETIKSLVNKKVKAIIWLGKDTQKMPTLFSELGLPVTHTESLKEAIEIACYAGKIGDIVLLSPGCPSFDLFSDYEECGREFRRLVNAI